MTAWDSEAQAARAGDAAAEQRRFAAARDVATGFQHALLPKGLPVLPRVRIAARYVVAAQDQAAGGDWFDALPLVGGDVALVVGDVIGHGVAASAAMGQLRAVLRHVLATKPGLAAALEEIEAFAATEPALRASTVCVAVLDPEDGSLRYAACGHPPPLVVTPDGAARYLPPTGSGPLGTGSATAVKSADLEPGEVLLLYSDGLIEQPGRSLEAGLARLAEVAGDAAADRTPRADVDASPADRVCRLTVELLTRVSYGDDVTLLAAQRLAAAPAALEIELPAQPGSVVVARRRLDGWLDQAGVAEADRQMVELAVTETITNAVEHAYPAARNGQVWLAAALEADGFLEVRVTDRGRWRTPDPAELDRGQGLMLAERIADELRVTHPPQEAGAPPGARGTVITLRQQLRRPAMLGSQPSGARVARPAPAPFTTEMVAAQPEPWMQATGPVDVTTAERFTSHLLTACRGGTLPLTVDLSAVTVLASAGVRSLDEVSAQLAAHGHELTLVAAPGSPAASVLDLAHLPRTSVSGG